MKVIALSGFKRSGKDTVAGIIFDFYDDRDVFCEVLPFGAPIYNVVEQLYGVKNFPEEKEKQANSDIIMKVCGRPMSLRQAVDSVGQRMKHVFGDEVWVNSIRHRINYAQALATKHNEDLVIVLPDVRFDAEFKYLDELRAAGHDVQHYVVFREEALPAWTLYGLDPNVKREEKLIKKMGTTISEYQWTMYGHYFNGFIENDDGIEDLKTEVLEKLKL